MSRLFFFLAALLLFAAANAGEVLPLTDETFSAHIQSHDYVFALFYAPWCGHCKKFHPEYDKAAEQLKDDSVSLIKVDCTKETETCGKYEVQGYPTIKFFRKGKAEEYQEARTAEAVLKFIKKATQPALVTLSTAEELAQFQKPAGNDLNVVGFIAENDKDGRDSFAVVADSLRNFATFGLVASALLSSVPDGHSLPAVLIYKSFDSSPVWYDGEITPPATKLEALLKEESLPLLDEFGPKNYKAYSERGVPLVYIFLDPSEKSNAEETLFPALRAVAKEFKGKISLVHMDGIQYSRHAEYLGVDTKSMPACIFLDMEKQRKYLLPQTTPLTAEAVKTHIAACLEGKLQPTLKSQPVPEKQEGNVRVIVGSTFKAEVLDSDKDVLVLYYAPWCGHCKALHPIFEEVADDYSEDKQIVLAKIDATANDVEGVKIEGFPTLYFYAKGSKDKPIPYEGERTAEAFGKFLEANRSPVADAPEAKKKEEL